VSAVADPAPVLRAEALARHFRRGPHTVKALDGIDLAVSRGGILAVVGASGSGKSTLLNLLAGLDTPTAGRILLDGEPLSALSRRGLARYRAERVGMIFQSFHLVPHYTARENVELAFRFARARIPDRRARAEETLSGLGLADRLEHRPADLSGGEQQRVAIARALVRNPDVLLADEPTGNLDETNTVTILETLAEVAREGRAVVMTTHDLAMAERYAGRIVRLEYGRVAEERRP
jgi:ABC-type lipoprotein export system ATPase subunit